MAKFRIGGSGPNHRGLGWIAGITERRFDKSGEIYETNDLGETLALRRCSYVEEITHEVLDTKAIETPVPRDKRVCSRAELRHKSIKELIKIGRGLYRVGMTKAELIDKIIARGCGPKVLL